jgi:DNA-binding protein HU-beta
MAKTEQPTTLTKADIVDAVAVATELSKKDAGAAVGAFLDAIAAALKKGEKVQLTGFGAFEVRARKERKGKNLQTGETITIAASKAPSFKAGKALKDSVQ